MPFFLVVAAATAVLFAVANVPTVFGDGEQPARRRRNRLDGGRQRRKRLARGLSADESEHLRRAETYLAAGDTELAQGELSLLSARSLLSERALEVRYRIYAASGRWAECCEAASPMTNLWPGRLLGWELLARGAENDQRSHAGRTTLECDGDVLPALAAAAGWPDRTALS